MWGGALTGRVRGLYVHNNGTRKPNNMNILKTKHKTKSKETFYVGYAYTF